MVGSKLMFCSVVFALIYFVLEGFSKYKPTGAYIQRGNLVESILYCEFEGLIGNFTVGDNTLYKWQSNESNMTQNECCLCRRR